MDLVQHQLDLVQQQLGLLQPRLDLLQLLMNLVQLLEKLPQQLLPHTVKKCAPNLIPQTMNLLGTDAPQLTVSVAHMEQMSSPVLRAWLGVRIQMTALMTVTTTVLAKMLEPQLWDQQQLSKVKNWM